MPKINLKIKESCCVCNLIFGEAEERVILFNGRLYHIGCFKNRYKGKTSGKFIIKKSPNGYKILIPTLFLIK